MMTIGEALKEERIKRGLSIRKMVGDIIDPSSYNKVEKGMRNIGSDALVRLLFLHNIDINEFFSKLEDSYAPAFTVREKYLDQQMRVAFNQRDLKKAEEVCRKIQELKGKPVLKLRAIVAIAYIKNNVENLSEQTKKAIFDQLDKNDDLSNNIEAIKLFANTMPVFTNEQLNYLMHIYISKIIKRNDVSISDQKRFAIASVNYLRACYERKIPLNDSMLEIENYIMEIDDSSFLVYKGVVKLSLAAIKGDKERAEQIKRELIDVGYEIARKWII